MLLRFTFVPWGSTHRPWRQRHGVRQPVRGESRPTSRSPSPPRGASDRLPWGSGSALGGEGNQRRLICIIIIIMKNVF